MNIPIELYTSLKIEDIEDNEDENEKDNLSQCEQTPFGDNNINNMMKYDIQGEKNRIVDKFNFEVINTEDFYKMLTDEKEK